MFSRTVTLLGAFIATSCGLGAVATAAGPPPPKSSNGHKVTLVASGLGTPTSFAFGGGNVFEGDGGNNQTGPPNGGVFLLKNGTSTKLAGSPNFVPGLAWHNNTLYVSAMTIGTTGPISQLLAWSGWNGSDFANKRVLYTAPKSFTGFNGIGFGADGRLYVGVSLGDTNDHSPSKAPHAFDILSFNASGKDLKVVARGLRQPWQMVFPRGSSSPFVSDLGQDLPVSVAKKAPDFIVRVKFGQNYGFPKCNWVTTSACTHFAKPFRFFSPHTDAMGLQIVGDRLYFSSFIGLKPTNQQRGQVASIPLHGNGAPKVLLSSQAAPIVGLGLNNGILYVGELTGNVYSIKP
jgi:glucose/arabinose dehydrogenase